MPSIQRALDHAHGAALASNGVGGRNRSYRVGAAIFNKKRVLAVKHNSYKTHPLLLRYTSYPYLHAEQAAVLAYGLDNCDGHEVCVVRVRRDGSLAMAKPCDTCQELLRDAGIVAVHFTTDNGEVKSLAL
jgi:deoxycytidylate deaminase